MAISSAYTLVQPARNDSQPPESSPEAQVHGHTRWRPWETGVLRRLPWPGLLSVWLAFCCGITACTLALVSNGKPLDYWTVAGYTVQPSVLLAILATLANALLAFAFAQGVTIKWWVSAFRGTSLRHLHSSHAIASGVVAVFTSRTIFSTVAIASVFMMVVLMDGPLLQRASSVTTATTSRQSNLSVPLSNSPFPMGSTGIIPDHQNFLEPSLYHPLFAQVLQQYNARNPITLPAFGCNGTCETEVVGPGWDITCTESSSPYRLISEDELIQYDSALENNGTSYSGPKRTQTMFDLKVIYNYTISGVHKLAELGACNYMVELNTLYKKTPGGNGTMGHRKCTLSEAIVRYPIHIENTTVTLRSMPLSENRTEELVWRFQEVAGQGSYPSTLGGFWLALSTQYKSMANISLIGSWTSLLSDSPTASLYLRAPNASALLTYDVYCQDPTDDIISMANELAFRTAVATTSQMPTSAGLYNYGRNLTQAQPEIFSPNLTTVNRTLTQRQPVSQSSSETVYQTHRGFLAGGLVVIGLACLANLPLYWGWWSLGRPVSMSPLEIARAFNAPMLSHMDPNATGGDLKTAVGAERVKFGPDEDGEKSFATGSTTVS